LFSPTITGDDLFHLSRLQQQSHAEIVHAGIVADDGEVLGAAVDQGLDQVFRNAAESESAARNRHAIVQQSLKRCGGVGIDFFHGRSFSGKCGTRIESRHFTRTPSLRPKAMRRPRGPVQRRN
jgi:hypothetical protein